MLDWSDSARILLVLLGAPCAAMFWGWVWARNADSRIAWQWERHEAMQKRIKDKETRWFRKIGAPV